MNALQSLLSIVEDIYNQMREGKIPEIKITTRTKQNIEFDESSEVWIYGEKKSTRSAKSVRGAYQLLRMVYVIGFLKEQILHPKIENARPMPGGVAFLRGSGIG